MVYVFRRRSRLPEILSSENQNRGCLWAMGRVGSDWSHSFYSGSIIPPAAAAAEIVLAHSTHNITTNITLVIFD